MHPLAAWLQANGRTQKWLEKAAKVSQSHISCVLSGSSCFRPETAKRIVRVTGGEVKLEQLVFLFRARRA